MNFVIFMVSSEFVSCSVDTYASFSLLFMLALFGLTGDPMLSMMRILRVRVWEVGGLGAFDGVGVFLVIFMSCFRYPFISTSFEHILISLSSTFPSSISSSSSPHLHPTPTNTQPSRPHKPPPPHPSTRPATLQQPP